MADLTLQIQKKIAQSKQEKAAALAAAKEKAQRKARARREHRLNAAGETIFDASELDSAYIQGLEKAPQELASLDIVKKGKDKAEGKVKLVLKTKKPLNKGTLLERLHKVIARCGIASVRKSEELISLGKVSVNGEVASIGQQVNVLDPTLKIRVNGEIIPHSKAIKQACRVLIYNKAEGELSTRKDTEGRPTVFDRLPRLPIGRWIQVGRLDANTTGLLLFTNDGELANRLMHPSYQISRKYLCRLYGEVTPEAIRKLQKGVMLEDGMAKFDSIRALNKADGEEFEKAHSNTWYEVTLSEGRNHEVKRLWETQDIAVSRLKRSEYAGIKLSRDLLIPQGGWLEADLNEINFLRGQVGLKPETEGFRPGKYGHTNSELKRQKNKQYRNIKDAIRKDSLHRPSFGGRLDERNADKRTHRKELVNKISRRNKEKFRGERGDRDFSQNTFTIERDSKFTKDRRGHFNKNSNDNRGRGDRDFGSRGGKDFGSRGGRDFGSRGGKDFGARGSKSFAKKGGFKGPRIIKGLEKK